MRALVRVRVWAYQRDADRLKQLFAERVLELEHPRLPQAQTWIRKANGDVFKRSGRLLRSDYRSLKALRCTGGRTVALKARELRTGAHPVSV